MGSFQNVRVITSGGSLFHSVVSLIFEKHILGADSRRALRSQIPAGLLESTTEAASVKACVDRS